MAQSPIRPTDNEARALAQRLISEARFASLGVHHPKTSHPHVSRIALALDPEGGPMTLISTLSLHTTALKSAPACSLLVGEPGAKGDPLTHPRLSISCKALFQSDKSLREHYLSQYPKAALYVDFSDFVFVRFTMESADLNGGFGKAFALTASDLIPNPV